MLTTDTLPRGAGKLNKSGLKRPPLTEWQNTARPGTPDPPTCILTARQLEVLLLFCEGWVAKEISSRLGIVTKTVDHHREQIFKRTGLHNLPLLTRWIIRHGLIKP